MRTLSIIAGAVAALVVTAHIAQAQCGFGHGTRTRELVLPLVQAFVPCEADPACEPDGLSNAGNTSTDIGVVACGPPETYNQRAGAPANGWVWAPNGYGTIWIKATTNRIEHPLNPPADTADVAVRAVLVGIEDAMGPADGVGSLIPLRRTTFEDRMNGDMTVVDLSFPSFQVPIVHGRGSLRTTANAVLNASGFSGVPGCTSLELERMDLLDENGTIFARPGIFVPNL